MVHTASAATEIGVTEPVGGTGMAPTCPVWDVTSTRPSARGVSDVG